MSSTGRKNAKKRSARDFYPTSAWCVDRFIESDYGGLLDHLKTNRILEPAFGRGNIVEAIETFRYYKSGLSPEEALRILLRTPDLYRRWTGIEISGKHKTLLRRSPYISQSKIADFLKWKPKKRFSICITNPPFKLAEKFLSHALAFCDYVILLLPLSFVASDKRHARLVANMPHQRCLPNRPSFGRNKHGKKGTDSNDYAWMIWKSDGTSDTATTMLLDRTTVDERKRREEWLKKWRKLLTLGTTKLAKRLATPEPPARLAA